MEQRKTGELIERIKMIKADLDAAKRTMSHGATLDFDELARMSRWPGS